MAKGLIEDTVDTLPLEDLVPDPIPEPAKPPLLTDTLIRQIVALLREVEKNNGFDAIAKLKGVSFEDVKSIYKAMQDRIASLTAEV